MKNETSATEKARRTQWLHIRLTPDEAKKISDDFKRTASRELSVYARRRLLAKPVTYYTRNQSLDAGLQELVQLRKELNSIGQNLNQLTKKLNSFTTAPGLTLLSAALNLAKKDIAVKLEELGYRMDQLGSRWLQGSTVEKV